MDEGFVGVLSRSLSRCVGFALEACTGSLEVFQELLPRSVLECRVGALFRHGVRPIEFLGFGPFLGGLPVEFDLVW